MAHRFKDITGNKIGRLTAIRRIGSIKIKNGSNLSVWLWVCDCGNEKEIPLSYVCSGNTKSCGCLFASMERGKDITGQRFGYLTAVKRVRRIGEKRKQRWIWELICDCGGKTESDLGNLASGSRKTCGCRISVRGANNYNWSGGIKRDSAGYVYLYMPDHPNSPKRNGYIAEHRLNMEKMIGRYLTRKEEVHHKNGIKHDNRPENLELWSGSHPRGARVADLVEFAREILAEFSDLFPEK